MSGVNSTPAGTHARMRCGDEVDVDKASFIQHIRGTRGMDTLQVVGKVNVAVKTTVETPPSRVHTMHIGSYST